MKNNWLFTSSPRKDLMCIVDDKLRMTQQFCAMEMKADMIWTYILSNLILRTQ